MCICLIIPKCQGCCCFNLHVGAYICSALELLFCFIDISFISTIYKYSVRYEPDVYEVVEQVKPDEFYEISEVKDKYKLGIDCILLVASLFLLIGIHKKKPLLISPYLYIAFINSIILIGYLTVRIQDDLQGWFFMYQIFSILFHVFIWFEVQSYFQILQTQRRSELSNQVIDPVPSTSEAV